MKGVVLVLCLLGLALADIPASPQIPDVFYAKVSVYVKEDKTFWQGGGIYVFDIPSGKARTDIRLEGITGDRSIHVLDRYDLNTAYIIRDHKCEQRTTSGTLENPWGWLAKATFAGNYTYDDELFYHWSFTSGSTTMRLSVLASDPNKPAFFATRTMHENVAEEWEMVFLDFTTIPGDWVWSVPEMCTHNKTALAALKGSPSSVVYFANSQWDCVDFSCASRVPAGTSQPKYQCAEFTARSLAYGGYLPGLAWNAVQSTYGNWHGHNLLMTNGLASYLGSIGFKKLPASGSSVSAAVAVFGNAGNGYFSHACIGIGSNTVDCHNNARKGSTATGIMFKGIDAVYGP